MTITNSNGPRHNTRAALLIWIAVGISALVLLFTDAKGQGPTTPPPNVAGVPSDTLGASAHVQVGVFNQWSAAGTPRFYCITSYAQWPSYTFVRHLAETTTEKRCQPGEPVFVQLSECPAPGAIPAGIPFVLIECGLRLFRQYENTVNKPLLPVMREFDGAK